MSTYFIAGRSETYKVNSAGEISRPSIGMNGTSGQWRVTGAVRRNNFGHVVERKAFPECMAVEAWRHKNGAPKWRLTDFDHGTHREWGEPIRKTWEIQS